MTLRFFRSHGLAVLLGLCACGDDAPPIADGGTDATVSRDAGAVDAGTIADASMPDAATMDAGTSPDAGPGWTGDGAPFLPPIPGGNADYFVGPDGDDSNPGTREQPWATVGFASTQVEAGDVVEILDGEYREVAHIQAQGTAGNPIVFRSSTGGAHFDGDGFSGNANRDLFFFDEAAHIVLHGIEIQRAPRSGVRISRSPHITVQACRIHDNGRWGIFTDFSDHTAAYGNDIWGSGREHGIYFSNSGDHLVAIGNHLHDNHASGVQINADPRLLQPELGTTGDGISEHCLIARNLITGNGTGGGAAINLASVRNSTIVNNVLLENLASGIAMWDDGQPDPMPWGSRNNLVAHNTVVFESGEGRAAIAFSNFSTGNTFRNNILVGGRRAAIEYDLSSLTGLTSDHNILASIDRPTVTQEADDAVPFETFAQWQARGFDANSQEADVNFEDRGAGDYRLVTGSPGHDQGLGDDTAPPELATDYLGAPRTQGAAPDLGAVER